VHQDNAHERETPPVIDELPAAGPTTTYVDTPDGALARAGVSLSRREGREDAGWHLEVPTDDGPHQVGAPLTRSPLAVPVRLRRVVAGWTRNAELVALAAQPELAAGSARELRRPKPGRPAALVVHARLAEQVHELLRRDCDVRLDVPDGVHQLRVACRRVRAVLRTFSDLLDPDQTDPIGEELQWLARTLGPSRDAEVADDLIRLLVSTDEAVGPVRSRVRTTYRRVAREARAEALAALTSERYFALLTSLETLVATPPWTDAAERPAKKLGAYVHDDWRRLRRKVRRLDAAREVGPTALDTAFHEVRGAAKRLRYAVETIEPVTNRRVQRLRVRSRDLTRLLGELQDTVVVRRDLLAIATEATTSGENAFTYGRLHLGEELHAGHLHADFDQAWRRLSKSVSRAELKGT
jgi:CHAD domain-containing protein